MASGFIYVIRSLTKDYVQKEFWNVPTEWRERIYFGPCKRPMRPKVREKDYIFGISPAKCGPRRIVFVAKIEERITFKKAFHRFPGLRGPEGPIPVRPIKGTGSFPHSSYEHIPGSIHAKCWQRDLASSELDAFFVCSPANGWIGRWVGQFGPGIDIEMLKFLMTCSIHGTSGQLSAKNKDATLRNPIAHGRLYCGLHLETDQPDALLKLCDLRMASKMLSLDKVTVPFRQKNGNGVTCLGDCQ